MIAKRIRSVSFNSRENKIERQMNETTQYNTTISKRIKGSKGSKAERKERQSSQTGKLKERTKTFQGKSERRIKYIMQETHVSVSQTGME